MPYGGNQNGDYLLSFYQEKGRNIMWPKTPVGTYIYWLVGNAITKVEDSGRSFLDDMSPLRCECDQLKFFATQLGIDIDPAWTCDQLRLLICFNWYNHETTKGIQYILEGTMLTEEEIEMGTTITVQTAGNSFRVSQEGEDISLMSDRDNEENLMLKIQGTIITVPSTINTTVLCWLIQEAGLTWRVAQCED